MIIVEGPDNSGKSTLINDLKKKFVLHSLSTGRHGPPVDSKDNYERSLVIISDAIKLNNNTVVDRLSLIGENIYGPILRGCNLWDRCPDEKSRLIKSLKSLDPFIIYCRPPDSVVLNLESHNIKEYDTKKHIGQINQNQKRIVEAYDGFFAFWQEHNFYRYDYTDKSSLSILINRLEEYLKW